jgi:hypothetical protein
MCTSGRYSSGIYDEGNAVAGVVSRAACATLQPQQQTWQKQHMECKGKCRGACNDDRCCKDNTKLGNSTEGTGATILIAVTQACTTRRSAVSKTVGKKGQHNRSLRKAGDHGGEEGICCKCSKGSIDTRPPADRVSR